MLVVVHKLQPREFETFFLLQLFDGLLELHLFEFEVSQMHVDLPQLPFKRANLHPQLHILLPLLL